MEKRPGNPSRSTSRRRIRTHAEWNVDTHIFSATGPTRPTDPVLHLAGRLVGEGDGEDLERGQALIDQMGDPVGEDAGLSRPGTGDDEQRPAVVQHRVVLGRIETGEQGRLRHRSHPSDSL